MGLKDWVKILKVINLIYFKSLEKKGIKVGAISPMNLSNNLEYPEYFIPDPWTDTKSDNNFGPNLYTIQFQCL